jgi:glycosyltransferase involved in cell wall biosynthesis
MKSNEIVLNALVQRPLISIVVPVYDLPSHYLRQCLDGLQRQINPDIEVFVIDDGSPSSEISALCDEYQNSFTIVHKKNEGVSVARNVGMQQARGEWVAFVDADDWSEPDMFSALLNAAKVDSLQSDIIFCNCYVEFEKRTVGNAFFPDNQQFTWDSDTRQHMLMQIMGKNRYYNPPEIAIGVPWGKLYRLDFLRKNNLLFRPELRRMQDNIFNLCAFQKAQNISYLNKYLYHYRKFEQSTSNRYAPNVVEDFEKVLVQAQSFVENVNPDPILRQAYYSRVVQSLHSYMKFWIFHPQNPDSYRMRKNVLKDLLCREPYADAMKRIQLTKIDHSIAILYVLLRLRAFRVLCILIGIEQSKKNIQRG